MAGWADIMNEAPRPSSAASQLRRDIDSGRTGDKIAHPDPAASPLGTDDEAGGAPIDRKALAKARAQETGRDVPKGRPDATGPWVWAIVGAVALVMAAAAAAVYWLPRRLRAAMLSLQRRATCAGPSTCKIILRTLPARQIRPCGARLRDRRAALALRGP
jgi:hypothetical protein